ncbi:GNAT family N-acetyltransferase [Leifsonia sp. TF02-11]|uniref:GNAT family N-acetyltransferase n=1 Tax=Leifsonia sp. TF02-11 TaxID=2815212 RepID=UPI001AA18FD8|nr:GNAT family N-acetyltransferase [Leifsonia sp. TF02-11]MBO1740946.1 GNAT family N-acetyltransferase [Leifsonia sp. TF02-11]
MERQADLEDVQSYVDIKRAAAGLYRDLGMSFEVDEERAARDWSEHVQRSSAWVWEEDGRVAAYLVLRRLSESMHIDQVTVHPDFAGRRIGAKLIEVANDQALLLGEKQLSLTTFETVPWNAPYYVRLGFTTVPGQQLSPEMSRILDEESKNSPAGWKRVVMTRRAG